MRDGFQIYFDENGVWRSTSKDLSVNSLAPQGPFASKLSEKSSCLNKYVYFALRALVHKI